MKVMFLSLCPFSLFSVSWAISHLTLLILLGTDDVSQQTSTSTDYSKIFHSPVVHLIYREI